MIDQQQAKFEGFALVEIMGHQRVAGFVTTEYFGNVAVFHVVMPEVAAEEIEIPARQWIETEHLEAGSRVRISRPKVEQFVAASSLYRLTPCTQADAVTQQPRVVEVIERRTRPLLNSGIECPNCFAAMALKDGRWSCTAGCLAEQPKALAAVAAVVDDEDLYFSEAEERSGGVAF
jgi:hypothetical protein